MARTNAEPEQLARHDESLSAVRGPSSPCCTRPCSLSSFTYYPRRDNCILSTHSPFNAVRCHDGRARVLHPTGHSWHCCAVQRTKQRRWRVAARAADARERVPKLTGLAAIVGDEQMVGRVASACQHEYGGAGLNMGGTVVVPWSHVQQMNHRCAADEGTCQCAGAGKSLQEEVRNLELRNQQQMAAGEHPNSPAGLSRAIRPPQYFPNHQHQHQHQHQSQPQPQPPTPFTVGVGGLVVVLKVMPQSRTIVAYSYAPSQNQRSPMSLAPSPFRRRRRRRRGVRRPTCLE